MCLSCEDITRESCAMVPRSRLFGDFLSPAFPASRVQQVSDLHPKFALGPHHVSKFETWCGPSANLECRSEMCCAWLAGNAGPKKSPKSRHLVTIAQLCRGIFSQLRQVSTSGKKLLSSSISPRCPHNMVNFGPLAAEICWRVWGTPANFNGFRVLAALLHGILMGVSQTLWH